MSTVSIDDIKAAHAKLADMIKAFEASAAEPGRVLSVPAAQIDLDPGEHYAGAILNEDGTIQHHLVLLPGSRDGINHADATEWASEIGGSLPTRREQSLLFANLKGKFEAEWYWSSETHENNGEYAWVQYFGYGTQNYYRKSYEGHARAVRRVTA